MTQPALQRPIGFAPSEISAKVNEAVVSQHAEEAAFLWTMRNRAVGEPHYSLDDLAALDERVDAHLDGLKIAADIGWKLCSDVLNEGPGEVFALAVLAFSDGDRTRMLEALQAGCASPKLTAGLISALGWLDHRIVSPWIAKLLEARSAQHRAVGIAACAIHRKDPGAVLAAAIHDLHVPLRARALRTVGELRRHDLANHLRHLIRDDDDACRFWATWSLAVNGHRDGVVLLTNWFDRNDAFSERALHVVLRALPLEESRDWISTLVDDPRLARLAVIGAGIVGDPVAIPWLIRKMESPELARLSGEAFTMITGINLPYHHLDQDAPTPDAAEELSIEQLLDLDYESNLPWPSPSLVARWWEEHGGTFSRGTRYLAGKPITRESLVEILGSGKQRSRAAAALELSLIDAEQPLFEHRAKGDGQRRIIRQWIS